MKPIVIFLTLVLSFSLIHFSMGTTKAATNPTTTTTTTKTKAEETHITPSAQAVEAHHSLHPPLDQSQVYWNFGGSTVLTKHFIRLTPSGQSRRGWLWNDYPLESNNFEIEFKVSVYSKPHFGGDGLGFWLLDGSHDPTFHSDNQYLIGDVFGMKPDFKGAGVIFDIYDNDGKRDNPAIFVVYNPTGDRTDYNHDHDYSENMYKNVSVLNGQAAPYRCISSIRNTEHPTRIMVRFVNQVLAVYIDNNDDLGYKSCLAVQFDRSFKDHHIAFSAMTGQVADTHEISEVSTKYLDSKASLNFEAGEMSYSQCSSLAFLYWTLVSFGMLGLLGLACYELYMFKTSMQVGVNVVILAASLNTYALLHYMSHVAVSGALLLTLFSSPAWILIALNTPIMVWRILNLQKKTYSVSPNELEGGSDKLHSAPSWFLWRPSLQVRQTTALVVYIMSSILCLHRWYHYC